jgi:bifunctional non-homologous end joining protein LigD
MKSRTLGRLQIHQNKGARIYTRNGHDWTNRFPIIADALDIPVHQAIFDGEVVVVHEERTNFSELQANLASGKRWRIVFYDLQREDIVPTAQRKRRISLPPPTDAVILRASSLPALARPRAGGAFHRGRTF